MSESLQPIKEVDTDITTSPTLGTPDTVPYSVIYKKILPAQKRALIEKAQTLILTHGTSMSMDGLAYQTRFTCEYSVRNMSVTTGFNSSNSLYYQKQGLWKKGLWIANQIRRPAAAGC